MSRWDGIEILAEVVEAGGFSAAARRLNVSKSYVSRQISQLENRLGVQLMNRTTRRVALTEIGRAYYHHCRESLHIMEEADQAILDQQSTPRGTLRLTTPIAFGERYIAPNAVAFMKLYPHLHMALDFTNHTADLVADGYDLAIRTGRLEDSSLIARRIAERKLYICGSRDYFCHHGWPTSITELKKHNCLAGSQPTWRLRSTDGHHTNVPIEGNWRSNNGYALLEAAQQGLGLVQLPDFYLQDGIKRGSLEIIMEEFQPTDTAVWAVYPSNRHLSPKVKMFVDFLVKQFETIDYL